MKKITRFLTIALLFAGINTRILASDHFVISKNKMLACTAAAGLMVGGFTYLVNAEDVTYSGKWVEVEDQEEQEKKENDTPAITADQVTQDAEVPAAVEQTGVEQAGTEQAEKKENKPEKKYVGKREVRQRSVKERLARAIPAGAITAGITHLFLYPLTPDVRMLNARKLLNSVINVAGEYALTEGSEKPQDKSILEKVLYWNSNSYNPLNAAIYVMQEATAKWHLANELITAATKVDPNWIKRGQEFLEEALPSMWQTCDNLRELHKIRMNLPQTTIYLNNRIF